MPPIYKRFSATWRERAARILFEGSRCEALLPRLPAGFKVEIAPAFDYDREACLEKHLHGGTRAEWVEDVRAISAELRLEPQIEAKWDRNINGARLLAEWRTERLGVRVKLQALSPKDCKIDPETPEAEREASWREPAKLHPSCEHAFSLLEDDLGDLLQDLGEVKP